MTIACDIPPIMGARESFSSPDRRKMSIHAVRQERFYAIMLLKEDSLFQS